MDHERATQARMAGSRSARREGYQSLNQTDFTNNEVACNDAIVETINPKGEMLGVAGLQAFLAERGHLPIKALLDEIYAYGQEFGGQATYDDDFTLVGLQIAG